MKTKHLLITLALFATTLSGTVDAQKGYFMVTGDIVAISKDNVVLKETSGEKASYRITKDTKFFEGRTIKPNDLKLGEGKRITPSDIKVGERASITVSIGSDAALEIIKGGAFLTF